MTQDCRAAAATTLARVLADGQALDVPLQDALAKVSGRDQGLLQQLCYGSLRHYFLFSGLLRQCLKSPLKKRDTDIYALLLIGLLQLREMRTPDHAAISTCVDACRSLGKPWATRLVNGVLRRCSREAEKLEAGLAAHEAANHPEWMLESLTRSWPDQSEDIVAANNAPPPMCLRVNARVSDRASYIKQLEASDIEATPCELAPQGLRLSEAVDVSALPGFSDGVISIQDEAAQLAAALLDPQPGDRILDACAAPGGKACHILEQQPGLAELVALDSEEARLSRVADNLARLKLEATLVCADARELDPALGEFDRILVDAPCSGSGVIRRHPDIKLLRRASDLDGFAALQRDILASCWSRLKPGGVLVYATCSVLPEENGQCVAGFMETHADAALLPVEAEWGYPAGPGRQLLPHVAGCDGLFYAVIQKRV